jgi:GT2 family glycosyltransferase
MLSIVFLNYNRISETRHTLEQLHKICSHRTDIEIIAVDNGSTDGTLEFLNTQTDWIKVISTGANLGIAGYNIGFEQSIGKYILVLDDDSYPADQKTLDNLITYLDQNPQMGVVACQIENPEGEIVHTWHLPLEDQPQNSLAFIGCGFAIRRDLFKEVGWYPEDFFLYQNEIDVAIKVRRAGFQIFYAPTCRVVHRGKPSDRPNWRRIYYPTRNTIWLIRRYFPLSSSFYLIFSRLCIGLVRALQCQELGWYFKAVREAFQTPIPVQVLPKPLRRELNPFWRQNSLWHQLTGHL